MKQYLDKAYWQDKDVEVIIGNLLRIGVLISSIVVIIGGFIYLVRHGSSQPHYTKFNGEPLELRSFTGVIKGAMELRGREIIQLGVLLLIFTPIARIFFSIIAFIIEKDYLYIVITLIVLGIITMSMLGGFGG